LYQWLQHSALQYFTLRL